MGDSPTTLDASAFGRLINVLWCPIESALKAEAERLGNLAAFCERVRGRYFEKDAEPSRRSPGFGARLRGPG